LKYKKEVILIDSAKIVSAKRLLSICLILVAIFLFGSKCKTYSNEIQITIFAAASLADLLNTFETEYESQNENIDLQISYGASNLLAQQIIKGAPANILIPAGTGPISVLNQKTNLNLQVYPFISNELVLVSHPDTQLNITNLSELANDGIKRFAIADPELAPAGEYSKIALKNSDMWDLLQPKLVLAPDVRATLTYVSSKNAEIGIVYSTDAMSKPDLKITKIPNDTYPKIEYPIILIDNKNQKNHTHQLIQYLLSDKTKSEIDKYGFKKIK